MGNRSKIYVRKFCLKLVYSRNSGIENFSPEIGFNAVKF